MIAMACPNAKNINEMSKGELQKYQQLTLELTERRPGFRKEIVLIVIGCMVREMTKVKGHIKKCVMMIRLLQW